MPQNLQGRGGRGSGWRGSGSMNLVSGIVVLIALVLMVGCGAGPTTSPALDGQEPSPQSLPTRTITFEVQVPAATPEDEMVSVLLKPFTDWALTEHVALTHQGDGLWLGSAAVEEDAMLHYVYDRWDGVDWPGFKTTREGHGDTVQIESRLLLVTPDMERVRDVVTTWNDLRTPAQATGTVAGQVVDAVTGEPLVDTNVSVAGLHTATDFEGRFRLDELAAGPHHVTLHRNLGDYRALTHPFELAAEETTDLQLAMEPAAAVPVTFQVALPEDTPAEAQIYLVGSVFQGGARPGPGPNFPIIAGYHDLPRLERVAAGQAAGTLELYEGTYVQYYYSLGSVDLGRERDEEGEAVFRSFVVEAEEAARRDAVSAWRATWQTQVTLRLTVPANTTPGVPVAFQRGPSHWMTQVGDHEWVAYIHGQPGETVAYRYVLGDQRLGLDGSPGLEDDGLRRFVLGDEDRVIEEEVSAWRWHRQVPDTGDEAPVEMLFRVTVPPATPAAAPIRLVGDDPAVAAGVTMTPQVGNPWVYEATVALSQPGVLRYHYDRGDGGSEAAGEREVQVGYDGQVVNDWITVWPDLSEGTTRSRPGFLSGAYLPDLWSPAFGPLSAGTFQRLVAHEVGWVALSSVWSYEQIDPLPRVGIRAVAAPSVLTQRQDLVRQIQEAHEAGLQVLLVPQFNMEMSPGGAAALGSAKSAAWWDAWLEEAERLWFWNALVAEETGVEVLLLPGYFFHVFGPDSVFADAAQIPRFDAAVASLMDQVRQVYSGQLLISGTSMHFTFPEGADFIGVTSFDTGHPDLDASATAVQWRQAYDALFAQRLDPLYQRWQKPVVFYQLPVDGAADALDPSNQLTQARQMEGMFQALADRSWLMGSFTWDYGMIDVPLYPSGGVRDRLAEAVVAKYYGLYAGQK